MQVTLRHANIFHPPYSENRRGKGLPHRLPAVGVRLGAPPAGAPDSAPITDLGSGRLRAIGLQKALPRQRPG